MKTKRKLTSIKPKYLVQVMKFHKRTYWYSDHIKELFLVVDYSERDFKVVDKTIKTNRFISSPYCINKIDCRIILKIK
jgi:hypothetical protein